MCICVYVYMCVCVYVCICVCVYVYMCICVYEYEYMCICVYEYMCICVYVYMCICVYVYTLISKKFGRQDIRTKSLSEYFTVRTFWYPNFFTSEIFPALIFSEKLKL